MLLKHHTMKNIVLLFTFNLFLISCISAQPKKGNKNPVDKYAENAYLEFMKPDGDKQKALDYLDKGLSKDSTYPKLWEYKAAILFEMKEYKKSYDCYTKLLSLEPDEMKHYYFYGICQKNLMMFDEAKVSLEKYVKANIRRSKRYEDDANYYIKNMEALKTLYRNSVTFEPQNLGSNINTDEGEYWPGLTLDGHYFYFTRMSMTKNGPDENFYRSAITDSVFGPAEKLPMPINTPGNEGTISITADGKNIFFSSTDRMDKNGQKTGAGSLDIYFSGFINNQWFFPANLGAPINSPSWESQPSISPDGLTLYFSSSRPGGYGGADIWKSEFKNGRFQLPENLGPEINTAGEEQAPFIHYDNQTLFFSSSGHLGAGGLDVFISKKGADGKFTKAVNVGVPINSEKDELGMIVDRLGQFGYLSSERPGGKGGLDIYRFELPASLKPEPVSYVQGNVFDAQSLEKLQASIELTDLSNGEVIQTIESQKNGDFFIVLKSNRNYMLSIDKTNYLFYSANFALKEHSSLEPYIIEVPLMKPDINKEVVLNNVFFDVDKYELKPESKLELDKLVHLMKKFPFMKIEIGGHTDNTGDAAKNKTLSLNRAKAVKDYLVKAGIDGTRMSAVGYGDAIPISDNSTPEGRAQNRRTVFKVLSVN
jgi:outer membrane protein OmpA-like peptidoglycan-associated protein